MESSDVARVKWIDFLKTIPQKSEAKWILDSDEIPPAGIRAKTVWQIHSNRTTNIRFRSWFRNADPDKEKLSALNLKIRNIDINTFEPPSVNKIFANNVDGFQVSSKIERDVICNRARDSYTVEIEGPTTDWPPKASTLRGLSYFFPNIQQYTRGTDGKVIDLDTPLPMSSDFEYK